MSVPRSHGSARWWGLLALLALWELVGRGQWVAGGALPAPSAVLLQWWADRGDYPAHLWGTLRTALAGYVIGNVVAIACGMAFVRWRGAERLMAGVNVTLFAMPTIALVPILVIALPGETPRVVLAALSVYYPTMVATVLGMTQVDPRLVDLVHVYGGRGAAVMRFVRWRSGLPTLLSGLRTAAPAAVLGSLLAEFGSGGSAGLGTYLIGSLGRGNPARLWGIGLTATLISAAAYATVGLLARRVAGDSLPASVPLGRVQAQPRRRLQDWAWLLAAVAMPVLLWWAFVWLMRARGVSEVVLRDPLGLWQHLVASEQAPQHLQVLGMALLETLPPALVGMVLGLGFAFVLAVVTTFWRGLGDTLLPVSLVTQSMPLVALAPLVVLIFGRDWGGTLAITVSVTFFPAFVTIVQGLQLVPRTLDDLVRANGGRRRAWLQYVALPWSLPYLCAAARLAAPRAFLGVMIAEWLATGVGFGNLLNESRGQMDYAMIWSVTVVAVLVAVVLHAMTVAAERRLLRRFALAPA
ncbi:hypothetical protein AAV94_05455 [Lampropedia cohaerens]|uniref:ABC transmembrane type-1 domain-containing protein n=1 Tax=Lampropedia cohaerens TaxID=1610491 RepID=A0A0U1Q0H8_9BURK|nr:ABC transporter permease subunit [Lampropedia cohaerens]KKW68274.1 hypothetical protein AAV94_05455 [Lampropedia cohaerens]